MAIPTREAYGRTLAKLVEENKDIVVLDADLSGSTKTALAKKVAPERHFNMGIAEANMLGVAAVLAIYCYMQMFRSAHQFGYIDRTLKTLVCNNQMIWPYTKNDILLWNIKI